MADAGDAMQTEHAALEQLVQQSTDPAFRAAGRATVDSIRTVGAAMVQGNDVSQVVGGYFASSQVLSAVCLRAAEQDGLGPDAGGPS